MLYPILTEGRGLIDLCGTWQFKLDDGRGFEEKWYAKPLDGALTMPVPASYNDIKEGVDFREHYGWVFYQRQLDIPAYLKSQRIVLRMAAVTHHAKVYLNDTLLCEHKGGFLPFEAEIPQSLVQRRGNLLTIAVDNRIDHSTLPVGIEGEGSLLGGSFFPYTPSRKRNKPNFDFFNYCGITRPVTLYTTPKDAYIKDITVTASVDGGKACLSYSIDVKGKGEVYVEVYSKKGDRVAESAGEAGVCPIADVCLWEPLKPYLYEIRVRFGEDFYTLPYGIRTVEVKGSRFLINGKPFYFKGYGKHEDTFPSGRGLNMPMNAKDISLMKWQGANSFRTSHYPYSEEMMRLCDEEGIVVIDETPAVGVLLNFGIGSDRDGQKVNTFDLPEKGGIRTQEHHKDVIRDLISRDKNHACVVMWSIANEADTGGSGAYEYFKPLFDLARSLDPQHRPCTLVSVQMPNYKEDCTIRLSDVFCLNRYYGWYCAGGDLEAAEEMCRKELVFWNSLGKPFMYTEYGADTVMGLHDTTESMFTEEYQVEYYKVNHKVVDELPCFVGEQVWNFADFATSQGLLRVQGNKKGLFTRDRRPKLAAHYFKERWSSIPDFGYKP